MPSILAQKIIGTSLLLFLGLGIFATSATVAGARVRNLASRLQLQQSNGYGNVGGVSIVISGNGSGSTNNVSVNQTTNTTINQTNNSNINTSINASSNTGGNSSSNNTGGSSSTNTGNSSVNVNVSVTGNTNSSP